MNDLLQTYAMLTSGLRADPRLCLASTVSWLDPLSQNDDILCHLDGWDFPQDEDGTLAIALHVTRKAFVDVYVQAVDAVRRGASYSEIDRLICGAIGERGIPLESLEWIGFGIPLPAYGVMLDERDFYTAYPDVLPVLGCFGISPDTNQYSIHVPDLAYSAGRLIAANLLQHEDERHQQIAWLMGWLFSCTGNSSIDFSYEEMCEFQPLSWEPDELAFAQDIIEEADGIMADALAGLALLNDQPPLLQALQHNVRRIYKAIENQKGKNDEPRIRLAWPHLTGGTGRKAESVA